MAGFDVIGVITQDSDLFSTVKKYDPDVIIVGSESPNRDTLEHLANLGQKHGKPMVMLTENSDEQATRLAAKAGISAYVAKDLPPETVRSLIEVSSLHFSIHHSMEDQLNKAKRDLSEQGLIAKAKHLLMERHQISEEMAHKALQRMAMDQQKKIATIAVELLRS